MAKFRVVFNGIKITKIEGDTEVAFCESGPLEYANLSGEGLAGIEGAIQTFENALHGLRNPPSGEN